MPNRDVHSMTTHELQVEVGQLRDQLAGKTQFCRLCEERERALSQLCTRLASEALAAEALLDDAFTRGLKGAVESMREFGLWRGETDA